MAEEYFQIDMDKLEYRAVFEHGPQIIIGWTQTPSGEIRPLTLDVENGRARILYPDDARIEYRWREPHHDSDYGEWTDVIYPT